MSDLADLTTRVERLEALLASFAIAAPKSSTMKLHSVIVRAAELWRTSPEAITGLSARRFYCRPRFAVVWVAQSAMGYSSTRIARILGGRDPSTIKNAFDRAVKWREECPVYRQLSDDLLNFVRGNAVD